MRFEHADVTRHSKNNVYMDLGVLVTHFVWDILNESTELRAKRRTGERGQSCFSDDGQTGWGPRLILLNSVSI